jgi:hypothetical protein
MSLYNINLLVFITDAECAYCAVRADYIYFRFILSLKGLKSCLLK